MEITLTLRWGFRSLCTVLALCSGASVYAGNSKKPWIGSTVAAEVIAVSSPDNAFEGLVKVIRSAKKELLVAVYQLDNPDIGDELLRAVVEKNVDLTVLLEGAPLPRIPTNELWNAKRLTEAGAKVYFYNLNRGREGRDFRYFHNKYTVADRSRVIVGSNNYGSSGHPVDPTHGNREWEVIIRDPEVAAMYAAAFQRDFESARGDWTPYGKDPKFTLAEKGYSPERSRPSGRYVPIDSAAIDRSVPIKTVFAPDNSLAKRGSILSVLDQAKSTILVEQLGIEAYWGDKPYNREREESPLLERLIAAAKKGVAIRVLLNDEAVFRVPRFDFSLPTITAGSEKEPRDNEATVKYLKSRARRERLPIEAKLFDFRNCDVGVIHNKGMVVDGEAVLVGSLNWGESAMKFNREAGVLLKSRAISDYYSKLFRYDWGCGQ